MCILKNKHWENYEKSNVYQKFQEWKNDSNYLESLVIKKTTWDNISINDLTDYFLRKINEVLSAKHNTKDKIKLLNIQHLHLDSVALPPDYDKKPEIWSWNGWIGKELSIDKFSSLIQCLRERGLYTDDVLIIDWLVRENIDGYAFGTIDLSKFDFKPETEFYICGSPDMVKSQKELPISKGFSKIYVGTILEIKY